MAKQQNSFVNAAYVLTFDFDFEKDIDAFPYLLDMLKKYDIKAGFAVIGKFVEKYPDIHKRAVEDGHEIINHTYTHPDNPHWAPDRFFNKLSYAEQKDEIYKAHQVFKNVLGIECIGFRTPHYGNLHTESVYPILAELGYKYSSSTAACGFKGYAAPTEHKHGIVEIPTGCSAHFPLAIFDSWNMLRKHNPFLGEDKLFIKEFDETMQIISEQNLFLTHYFDPYDIIENSKLDSILKILKKYDLNTVLYKDIFPA
ncbi:MULTISPECIES: polysaccharide deacetylase family protein [unclassified Maridesulfovibrio]|uniref:polysaccharide deacetylase family protein n=1 Tax=unclassified Maridesulfovibrio TaxID=2794999 RepID=UPI003B3FA701